MKTKEIKFRKFSNFQEIENVHEYINIFLQKNPKTKIAVGSDSLRHKKWTTYVTVIALFYPTYLGKDKNGEDIIIFHKGAHLLYFKKKIKEKPDLWTRLWTEVDMTQKVANKLEKIIFHTNIEKSARRNVEIHLDINSNVDYKSNKLFNAAVGMFKGQGFVVKAKPDSWVASSAADIMCK